MPLRRVALLAHGAGSCTGVPFRENEARELLSRGHFVTFEGIDGSGKTTQLAIAAKRLRARGLDLLSTREPTSGIWGKRIRTMASSDEHVDPATELEWFIQDRSEHVRREIHPALESGRSVLCDRYMLSTVAYQGARPGASAERWRDLLDDQLTRFPEPDLALVFVLDPARSLERVRKRGATLEPAFEEQGFLERVAAIYEELCGCGLPWVERIDAAGDVDEISARVDEALTRRLPGDSGLG